MCIISMSCLAELRWVAPLPLTWHLEASTLTGLRTGSCPCSACGRPCFCGCGWHLGSCWPPSSAGPTPSPWTGPDLWRRPPRDWKEGVCTCPVESINQWILHSDLPCSVISKKKKWPISVTGHFQKLVCQDYTSKEFVLNKQSFFKGMMSYVICHGHWMIVDRYWTFLFCNAIC